MHSGKMSLRFIQFLKKNRTTFGLGIVSKCGNNFVEISANGFPSLFVDFLKQNMTIKDVEAVIPKLQVEQMTDDIKLLPSVINPTKILSLNNSKYRSKTNIEITVCNKLPSCLTGPTSKIILPKNMDSFKCRPELGLVIAKKTKNVSAKDAMDHIFGYTAALNVTHCKVIKDNEHFWLDPNDINQSSDSFCPLGPTVVHKSVISNPYDLLTSFKINGKILSCDKTNGLMCPINDLIELISKRVMLSPGDIILLGPPNVKNYNNRCDVESVRSGHLIECEFEEIGSLRNEISKEII